MEPFNSVKSIECLKVIDLSYSAAIDFRYHECVDSRLCFGIFKFARSQRASGFGLSIPQSCFANSGRQGPCWGFRPANSFHTVASKQLGSILPLTIITWSNQHTHSAIQAAVALDKVFLSSMIISNLKWHHYCFYHLHFCSAGFSHLNSFAGPLAAIALAAAAASQVGCLTIGTCRSILIISGPFSFNWVFNYQMINWAHLN